MCRRCFEKNFQSCVRDLSHCSDLSGTSNLVLRKPSRLKRTMTFVKHLGRKRSVAENTPEPSPHDIVHYFENTPVPSPHDMVHCFEKDAVETQRELGTDCQISELSEKRQTTESRPKSPSTNEAPQKSNDELTSNTSSVSPPSNFNSSNVALSPLSDSSCSSTETMINQTLNVVTSTPNPELSIYFEARGLTLQQTIFSKREKISGLLTRFSRMDRDSSEYILTATEDLFEDLRSKVKFLSQKWIRQLDLLQNADVRSFLSKPFKKGIQTLQDFYRGILPRTFENIFALMHVVYACAFIYHKTDETAFWHTLFLSVIEWRFAIATREDVSLFLRAAFRLWADPEPSLTEVAECYNDFPLQLSRRHSQQSGPREYNDLDMSDLSEVRDKLREGQVISLCTRYLDGKQWLSMDLISICLELKMCRFRL